MKLPRNLFVNNKATSNESVVFLTYQCSRKPSSGNFPLSLLHFI